MSELLVGIADKNLVLFGVKTDRLILMCTRRRTLFKYKIIYLLLFKRLID